MHICIIMAWEIRKSQNILWMNNNTSCVCLCKYGIRFVIRSNNKIIIKLIETKNTEKKREKKITHKKWINRNFSSFIIFYPIIFKWNYFTSRLRLSKCVKIPFDFCFLFSFFENSYFACNCIASVETWFDGNGNAIIINNEMHTVDSIRIHIVELLLSVTVIATQSKPK